MLFIVCFLPNMVKATYHSNVATRFAKKLCPQVLHSHFCLCPPVLSVVCLVTTSLSKRAWEWDQEPGNETKSLGMGPRAWEWDQELGNGTKSLGMGPRSWEWDQELGSGTKILGMGPSAWEWDQDPGNEAK